jgi:hypothetical protein
VKGARSVWSAAALCRFGARRCQVGARDTRRGEFIRRLNTDWRRFFLSHRVEVAGGAATLTTPCLPAFPDPKVSPLRRGGAEKPYESVNLPLTFFASQLSASPGRARFTEPYSPPAP